MKNNIMSSLHFVVPIQETILWEYMDPNLQMMVLTPFALGKIIVFVTFKMIMMQLQVEIWWTGIESTVTNYPQTCMLVTICVWINYTPYCMPWWSYTLIGTTIDTVKQQNTLLIIYDIIKVQVTSSNTTICVTVLSKS